MQGRVILNLTPNITLSYIVINLKLLYSFELKVPSTNPIGLSHFYSVITEYKLCFRTLRPEVTYSKKTNLGNKLLRL